MILITEIKDKKERSRITRLVLEALPDWFGIPDTVEQYVSDSEEQIMVVAMENNEPIGFLCLKETGKHTVELAVMGVLAEYHRQGVGRKIFEKAKLIACENGYSFMQVKTVQMGKYESYDKTNRFYIGMGFKEFEVLPTLWDENNPCQIYVMALD